MGLVKRWIVRDVYTGEDVPGFFFSQSEADEKAFKLNADPRVNNKSRYVVLPIRNAK